MNIPYHPTWEIKDSSKLDTYLRCRRMFLYEYIMGWRVDFPAHDLHFGHSWHVAREFQLLNGYEDVMGAYNAFNKEYRKEFHPDDDELYKPKNPTGVLNALMAHRDERPSDLLDNELVIIDGVKMTEISGTVPVDEKRVIYYRLDTIVRRKEDNMIFSWDHKSTSEKWINSRYWTDGFDLGLQNGTYTHCLYCMFPMEQVLGIEFCGTGFTFLKRGSKNRPAGYHCTLRRVPTFKTPEQMNTWLWLINRLLDELEEEMDRLHHCQESDPVLMAFPMNPHACTDFFGCPYHDYCLAWQNPLQNCYEPPLGFKIEYWDPSAMDTRNKKDLKWVKG